MSPELQLTLLCIGCFLAGAACCQVFNWWLLGQREFLYVYPGEGDTKPAPYTGDKYL